jgi:predicted GNAT family N-acyltransferase
MDVAEIPFRWATDPDDVRGAVGVREEVFCREQGVPRAEELDGLDDGALHLLALQPGRRRVIGTLRLLLEEGEARVGRVAVERDWRGRGIASRMLELALVRAREHGCEEVRLASQLKATGLYERAGFTVRSRPFDSAGIPHVWMRRRLTPRTDDAPVRDGGNQGIAGACGSRASASSMSCAENSGSSSSPAR